MISLQSFRNFFLSLILTFLIAVAITFGVSSASSSAATLSSQLNTQPQAQLATMNRVKAVTTDLEGKAQEALGNVTGNPKDQLMGKIKQSESQARNAAEDTKNNVKLPGRAKAITTNLEGKAQEASGNLTGNRKDQVSGKAKQVESQARNAVEDVKEAVQDIFTND